MDVYYSFAGNRHLVGPKKATNWMFQWRRSHAIWGVILGWRFQADWKRILNYSITWRKIKISDNSRRASEESTSSLNIPQQRQDTPHITIESTIVPRTKSNSVASIKFSKLEKDRYLNGIEENPRETHNHSISFRRGSLPQDQVRNL